jgi:hypothetical protein
MIQTMTSFCPPCEVVSGIMIFDDRLNWRLFSPWTCRGAPLEGRAKILMRDEDKRILEPFEYGKKIIDISADPSVHPNGTLDKSRTVIFPLKDGSNWIVRNDAGQTLNLKGRTGNGVTIAQGTVKTVFANGTNLYG